LHISCDLLLLIRIEKEREHGVSLCICVIFFDETVQLTINSLPTQHMQCNNLDGMEEAETLVDGGSSLLCFERMINSSFPAREAWLKEFVLMYIDIN
jgi:hypothetical protein